MVPSLKSDQRARQAWGWLAAGILVLQLSWTIVVPPYAGIDEFEQAYRAASVGEGYVVNEYVEAENGRGGLIRVPADVVERTEAICLDLEYPGPDGCVPVEPADADGNVLIASVMATYNPLYYLAVGYPTSFLEGDTRLYAMRILTALICWGLLVPCLRRLTRRTSSPWPLAGLAVALTPVTLYGSATVAPNGVGFVAGIAAWTIALTMLYGSSIRGRDWWLLAISLGIVGSTHTTGPLWALLIGIVLICLPRGRQVLAAAWSTRRTHLLGAASLSLAIGLFAAGWTLSQGTNLRNGNDDLGLGPMPWEALPAQLLSWIVQTIGAVPFRNELIPLPAIAALFVLFVVLMTAALRRADRMEQLVLSGIAAAFVLLGTAISFVSHDGNGWAWQGRYALPLCVGLPLLAGWILAREPAGQPARPLSALIWTTIVVVQTWATVDVSRHVLEVNPESLTWTPPPTAGLVAVGGVGAALIAAGLRWAGGAAPPASGVVPVQELEVAC